MSKKIVAYFSVLGTTKKAAQQIAELEQAELFEIVPETPYTAADLDYTNKNSRSSVEMGNIDCRPAMASKIDLSGCDTIFLGFPIWWGREPSIVDSFIDSCSFAGKKIIPFCTSGGSGIEAASERIALLTGADVDRGLRLGGDYSEADLKLWTDGLNLL